MIITIDGPAGSGKSTAARKLAAALEIPYLDTGAMYRAIALKALNTGTPLDDPDALTELARDTRIELDCGPTHVRVMMDGHDVSEAIRSMHVSEHTSAVARVPGVRQVLVEKQRTIGRQLKSLVTEGRDQGSVVFPDADVKFVLDASDMKRAERRYHELLADGEEQVTFDEVLENIRQRDDNDRRQWAPLLAPGRSIRIDTTHMTIHEVVERLLEEVRNRQAAEAKVLSAKS
ncbi:MAG TPA: (d)CMP kinase [Phycisphaerae bacterium]|jgi:cytidylate kinase|nr:(d)CMP kinase [Phycisphaerae bacterium]HOJ55949.1 (d)CMP kinase [Phycisphaerae bacterium]HOL26703.1 (d)CMP kinase [Phycisphaerae bacterium]HPP20548.1 (d)CMP kinase [Phycisphaerae bacterium]HPU33333.1 (d)CMP kinase [Phycisphaerae bacterium]